MHLRVKPGVYTGFLFWGVGWKSGGLGPLGPSGVKGQ